MLAHFVSKSRIISCKTSREQERFIYNCTERRSLRQKWDELVSLKSIFDSDAHTEFLKSRTYSSLTILITSILVNVSISKPRWRCMRAVSSTATKFSLSREKTLTSKKEKAFKAGTPVWSEVSIMSFQRLKCVLRGGLGRFFSSIRNKSCIPLKLYNEAWPKLMENQHRFPSHGPLLDRSVLTTWTLLFRHLKERSANAAKLLVLLGFLDNRDIWYDLFRSALTLRVASELPGWYTNCVDDYSNFIECTQLFILYSFIDVRMGSSSFSVHPVLHQWYYQASEDIRAEMAWVAFILVASSAPDSTMTDYTLI